MTEFYVYELIDPRDGKPFYVGKGQRQRVAAHEKEARAGVASPKCEVIRAIWADGGAVERRIVKRFKTDAEAYAFEAEHVASIGRENLTNRRDGGFGGRVKFGKVVLVEEVAQLLWCVKEWAKRGSVSSIDLGRYGVLDLAAIIAGYKARIAEIAAVVGQDTVKEQAARIDFAVEFV